METLDHIVVAVPSVTGASGTFRAAGFTVTPGGRHDAVRTENALVCFADGGYLELLAAREPSDRADWRALAADAAAWERHLRGASAIARRFLASLAREDGVADWCLRGEALEPLATLLRGEGFAAAGPVPMSRERPKAGKLEWDLLLPESRVPPFWIRDRTPRERRVPGTEAATRHANGALGIRAVRVRARSAGMAALTLGTLLGVVPRARPDGRSVLDLGAWRVELVAGEPEGACGATIAGCRALPDGVRALGVEPAGD